MSRIVDIEPLLKKYDGMNEGTEFSPIHFINDLMALEQQPCEDCISRQAVIEHICESKECYKEECKGRTLKRCPDLQWVFDMPLVTPKYTDEEIDKAQAVEQAYVDKMVELAVEEIKERYSDAIGKMKKAIDEMTEIHSDGEFYIKNVDAKWIISKYLCGAEMKEANDG